MIIVIEGPEKAGKTTLIAELRHQLLMAGFNTIRNRKWGPAKVDDREYGPAMKIDAHFHGTQTVIIWDRGWVSEHVYAKLLNRNRRLKDYPWLGEWLHGRATPNKFILAAPEESLRARRDRTDLPVDPGEELEAFLTYGVAYNWHILWETTPKEDAERIISLLQPDLWTPPPSAWAGPAEPETIFVESRLVKKPIIGGWLPWSGRHGTKIASSLGVQAFEAGWTVAGMVSPILVRHAKFIKTFGIRAEQWVKYAVLQGGKDDPQHEVIRLNEWTVGDKILERSLV